MSSPFQRKFSSKSPFSQKLDIDPTKLEYQTTDTATNLAGQNIETSGEAMVTIPGTYKGTGIKFEDSWDNMPTEKKSKFKNFEDYKRQAIDYIEKQKEKNARQVKVVRERDYTQDVKPPTENIQTRLYSNPFENISYSQYGGTQEDQGFNYQLKQAKTAGEKLSLDQIKELGLSVYGQGFYTQPGITAWMRENKLSYGKGKKPDTTQTTTKPGTESESLGGYTYRIEE